MVSNAGCSSWEPAKVGALWSRWGPTFSCEHPNSPTNNTIVVMLIDLIKLLMIFLNY
jgi:hypothetical protein